MMSLFSRGVRHDFARVLARMLCLAASVAFAAPAAPAAAQSSVDTSFSLPRNAVININVHTGHLIVRGTDRNTAELRSDNQNYELRSTGIGVTLSAGDDRGASRRGARKNSSERSAFNGDGRLELTVPRTVRLVITAASADVDVQDIGGDVEVHAMSGDVTLRTIGGRAIVETMSGSLRLTGGASDARATTISGDITLRGVRGTADLRSTSGSVSLTIARASQVRIETVSGDVSFDGDVTDDARLQLSSHSGDVSVRVPENVRGVIDVATYSGEFTTNRPLTLNGTGAASRDARRRDRNTGEIQRYEFGAAAGNVRVSATTFSGDIRFNRTARNSPDESEPQS